MTLSLRDSVALLKGVGEKRLQLLKKAGILTVEDLLSLFPREYRSGECFPLGEDRVGKASFYHLTALSGPGIHTLHGGRRILRYTAADEDGTKVQILFINQVYLRHRISRGDEAYYYGTLQKKNGVYYLFSPQQQAEAPDPALLTPVYPQLKGISSKTVEQWIRQCLVPCLPQIKETLPSYLTERYHLLSRNRAVFLLHAPTNRDQIREALRRLQWEALFSFSVKASLLEERCERQRVKGFSQGNLSPFLDSLPFSLTEAQKRVIEEISRDLISSVPIPPMNRLLQGDVGSGKTVVAAAAAYLAAENGKATLLMAPTEILARQHFQSFSRLFQPFSIPVFLLTGSTPKKKREAIFRITESGSAYVLIGTHALTEESARCSNVSLAITDEQHRFGVRQRSLLGEKGGAVHSLVMSATPIPRSLAMFLHARSHISVIDQLPPGRQTVNTLYVGEDKLPRVYSFLREQIAKGQQAYVVCPLIEDEENSSPLQSAKEEFEEIRGALPEISIGLLHGKMKNEEKASVMEAFRQGEIRLLVSTTVIEVGVDVPQATVMVIRCAERFGLSQLHQLRGRVGRGKEKSFCILVSSHSAKSARERLKKLCDCHDGFELAAYDLKTRGPGDFFGTRQSGFDGISFQNVSMEELQTASEAARLFLENASSEEILPYKKEIGFH